MFTGFDLRTLSMFAGLIALILAFCMIYFTIHGRVYPGYKCWIVACVVEGVGRLLLSARDHIPDFLSVIVANGCTLFFYVMVGAGINAFVGRRSRLRWFQVGLLAATLAAFAWYTYGMPNVNARIVLYSAAAAAIAGSVYVSSVRDLKRAFPRLARPVELSLAVLAVWFAFRIPYTLLFDGRIDDFLASGLVHQAGVVLKAVLNITLVVALIIATTERWRRKLAQANEKLAEALAEVDTLRGIIPICSYCKRVRNDDGYFEAVEAYVGRHSEADFSHTLCPECLREKYPEFADG